MPRVRLAAVLLLAVLLPLTAGAVGLGEIRLESALNEPFVAEIPVTLDASEEAGQLQVQLAPEAAFQRFGVDRPAFLDNLSFQVRQSAGKTVIRVTSKLPASEPFLSLLLDVTWPQGRLLREYTVLLDPPSFRQAESAAVRPSTAAAPPAAAGPAPRPAPIERAAGAPPAEPDQGPAPAATSRVSTNAAGESSYGPVRANETLWAISEQLRGSLGATGQNVSVNQMMMALYRANPEAFAGNINRLHRGAVLRIPASGDVAAMSGGQATAEVLRQDSAWRAEGSQGGQAGQSAADTGSAAAAARLRLVPPPAESAGANAPGGGTDAGSGTGGAADRAALEQELADKQRLLNLKDNQLKALQDRVSQLEGGQAPPPSATTPAEPSPAPGAETSGTPAAVPPPAPAATTETAKAAQRVKPNKGATTRVRPAKNSGQSGQGWFDTLLGLVFNMWFLIAAAAVLLAGTIFVFGRRRMQGADASSPFDSDMRGGQAMRGASRTQPAMRRDGYSVEEGAVDQSANAGAGLAPERTQVAPARGGADPDAEMPLERTISTEGAVELDQADVVAEAEFHMAYGLYDQAAELLTRALAANPGRRDLRLKLLEVYFIWENRAAFLKEAQAYKQQLKGADDPNWNKIVIMGKQICPSESLFAGAVAGGAAGLDLTLADDAAGGAQAVDISFDGADDDDLDLDLTAARPGPSSDLLDFDLGTPDGDGESDPTGIDGAMDDTSLRRTVVAPEQGAAGRTSEMPTIEALGPGDPTMETPTLETPAVPGGGSTLETPTLESAVPGYDQDDDGRTVHAPGRPGAADQTEEINLEDLGLDLTGLDEVADELGTGVHGGLEIDGDGAASAPAGDEADDFGIGGVDDDVSGLIEGMEGDSTAEMRGMAHDEGTFDLPEIGNAMEKHDAGRNVGQQAGPHAGKRSGGSPGAVEDTAEHPAIRPDSLGDVSGELSAVDFDIGDNNGVELEPTAVMTGRRRGPDGPTMTEVGTKLDLARAYVDMGDPDGARSILNEVIEEGDTAQRQEARRLLDDLTD